MSEVNYTRDKLNYISFLLENNWSLNDILRSDSRFNQADLIEAIMQLDNKKIVNDSIDKMYSQTKINADKILIVADSHIGSMVEDRNMFYHLFEFANMKAIYNIVFAGDLIQGETHLENIKYHTSEQLKFIDNIFTLSNGWNYYYLLGNHELNLYYQNKDYYNELQEIIAKHSCVNYLGYENGYISLNDDDIIRIHHSIPYIPNEISRIPNLFTNITFEGHSHSYFKPVDNNGIIGIPPLFIYGFSHVENPGFLEVENLGEAYRITCKTFDQNYNVVTRYNGEDIVVKKLKRK